MTTPQPVPAVPNLVGLLESHAHLPPVRRLNEVVDIVCRAYDLPVRQELSPVVISLVTILVLMLFVTGRQRKLLALIRREEARRDRIATAERSADPCAGPAAPEISPKVSEVQASSSPAAASGPAPAAGARPSPRFAAPPQQAPRWQSPQPTSPISRSAPNCADWQRFHPPEQLGCSKSHSDHTPMHAHFVTIS